MTKKSLGIFIILPVVIFVGVFVIADSKLGLNNTDYVKDQVQKILDSVRKDSVINQIDNTPLEIEASESKREVLESNANILIKSNKKITIAESSRTKLIYVKDIQGTKYYVLEINGLGLGETTLTVSIADEAGNSKEFTTIINRLPHNLPFGLTSIEPWPNFTYTVNPEEKLAQLDKSHRIIQEYSPADLKDLSKDYQLYTNSPVAYLLRKEAADYLKLMLDNLRKDTGQDVVITSAYRSYNNQLQIYTGWLRDLGQEETDRVSARPGFSEHHLGTVVDFVNKDTEYALDNKFGTTVAGQWLKQNAAKYGFVQSYPAGKETITGYAQEEWHWRYIGADNAEEFLKSGLTLNKWLETKN